MRRTITQMTEHTSHLAWQPDVWGERGPNSVLGSSSQKPGKGLEAGEVGIGQPPPSRGTSGNPSHCQPLRQAQEQQPAAAPPTRPCCLSALPTFSTQEPCPVTGMCLTRWHGYICSPRSVNYHLPESPSSRLGLPHKYLLTPSLPESRPSSPLACLAVLSPPRGLPVIHGPWARRQLGHIPPPWEVHGLRFDPDCWMYFYFPISCQHLNIRIHIQIHIPSFSKKQKTEDLARQGPYSSMATVSSSWVVTAPFLRMLHRRISHSPRECPSAWPLLSIAPSVPAKSHWIHESGPSGRQRAWLKCVMASGLHYLRPRRDSLARPVMPP